ncbi:hypothetical protein MMPV_007033 [Pyropia vietnamensis]
MALSAAQLTIIAVFLVVLLAAAAARAAFRRRHLAALLARLPTTPAELPAGALAPAARSLLAAAPRTVVTPPPVNGSGEAGGEYAGVHFASAVSSALGLLAPALREQADGVDRREAYYGAKGGGKRGDAGDGGSEGAAAAGADRTVLTVRSYVAHLRARLEGVTGGGGGSRVSDSDWALLVSTYERARFGRQQISEPEYREFVDVVCRVNAAMEGLPPEG